MQRLLPYQLSRIENHTIVDELNRLMKKTLFGTIALTVTLLCSGAEPAAKDKVVTGVAKCGKCALKESETCQNVIEVKKGNKKTTYYLADNDVSKAFHKSVCTDSKKVKATLSVETVDGKQVYTAKKIEPVD